jgi:hypothetical protein
MWPTNVSLLLLLLGVIPLAIILKSIFKNGVVELSSLRTAGVLFFWVGYHFTAWQVYFSGQPWPSVLTVPEWIDAGLFFSATSMILFLIGYDRASRGSRVIRQVSAPSIPRVGGITLLVLAISSFLLLVFAVGGPKELWSSDFIRGAGQFDERGSFEKLKHSISTISTMFHLVLGAAASVYLLQNWSSPLKLVGGTAGLIVSAESAMNGFSRGVSAPFLLLAFLACRMRHKMAAQITILSLTIALVLTTVSLNSRLYYNTGVKNYFQAVADFTVGAGHAIDIPFLDFGSNPLDNMPPWTRRASTVAEETQHPIVMAFAFLWNLNPLPSEVVPLVPIGRDLAEVMHTVGKSGITTPAFGEMFYVFGQWGCLCVFGYGWLLGRCEGLFHSRPSFVSTIGSILCFASLAFGLQSPTRAMTRPIAYALIMYGVMEIRRGGRMHRRSLQPHIVAAGKKRITAEVLS